MSSSLIVVLGFALGVVSAIFFALYMVPQRVVKLDTLTYLWTIAIGVLLTALVPYLLAGCPQHSSWTERGEALICGVVWALGTMAFSAGITRIGLALATPIKNTTGVLGTLVGLIFFQEWRIVNPLLTLLGSILIVLSAIVIGQTGRDDVSRRSTLVGIFCALMAALCYASYLYPMKLVLASVDFREFTPWMGLGILLTATLAVILRPDRLSVLRRYPLSSFAWSLLGGVAWTLALYAMIGSLHMVGLSISWSLAQLNTIPAVFLGIMVFHEVRWSDQWRKVLLGLLFATLGTVALALAK